MRERSVDTGAGRLETTSEHIARDMREGRFPERSEPQMVPMPRDAAVDDDKAESDGDVLSRLGMDGHLWAKEFHKTATTLGYQPMDEGWLIGWFCNAIMAGYDTAENRALCSRRDDYFADLVAKARTSAAKASVKFPQPNYVTLKIAEEAGEVVRGAVHYAEGRMEWSEVEGEIVQLLAMLIRFVTEGDQVNGISPPLARHCHRGGPLNA